MKIKNRTAIILKLLLCLTGVLWLAGCQNGNVSWYGPTGLDSDYRHSVHNNIAQSVLNPRAGSDVPTTGLAPTPGVNEMERYDKSFKGEEKKAAEMKITY